MLKLINNVRGLRAQSKLFIPHDVQRRNFWEFVNMMFNKPDPERIKKLGPDRACAEWILRNGGKVVWAGGKKIADYNLLPTENHTVPKITEIDATDCGISHYGFPHLVGCSVQKIIIHNAKYIDDRAMKGLSYGKDTLTHLQVSECANVTDDGIKELKELYKLENLVLFNLPSVDNLDGCKTFIQSFIPNCKITGATNVINEKNQ